MRERTQIAPEFWKYVNDSAFFSETDMTLVQVSWLQKESPKVLSRLYLFIVFVKGAFFGQVLMYPEHYGAGWLTQQQVLQQAALKGQEEEAQNT